jgi:hypothetical protein
MSDGRVRLESQRMALRESGSIRGFQTGASEIGIVT